jgi:hypothetical protein
MVIAACHLHNTLQQSSLVGSKRVELQAIACRQNLAGMATVTHESNMRAPIGSGSGRTMDPVQLLPIKSSRHSASRHSGLTPLPTVSSTCGVHNLQPDGSELGITYWQSDRPQERTKGVRGIPG